MTRLHRVAALTKELHVTTKQAIEQAMSGRRKPMTVAEIAEAAIPMSNLRGARPIPKSRRRQRSTQDG